MDVAKIENGKCYLVEITLLFLNFNFSSGEKF